SLILAYLATFEIGYSRNRLQYDRAARASQAQDPSLDSRYRLSTKPLSTAVCQRPHRVNRLIGLQTGSSFHRTEPSTFRSLQGETLGESFEKTPYTQGSGR